ncbi:MAG: amidohydrolase family protein [Vicinamibacterales bacterium]
MKVFLSAPALALACLTASGQEGQLRLSVPARPLLIVGGTLIDGTGAPPRRNDGILIEKGRLRTVGSEALRRVPREARTIDASDKWIMPGLIDGHVHFFQTGGLDARPDVVPNPAGTPYRDVVGEIRRAPQKYLRSYICAGITGVVDPGGPLWTFDLRESREDDRLSPRIAVSGPLLATYDPPALELDDDEPIWLMKDEGQIGGLVERLAARRPDMVKIWFVTRRGDDLEKQSALVRAAIAAIHARKLRAAVHATSLETARIAVKAGADILVHSIGDRDVDDEFVTEVARRGVIYVPTIIVGRSYREVRTRSVSFEPFERDCAPAGTIESFDALKDLPESLLPRPQALPADPTAVLQRNLKRLAGAGAVIAAGTDAGNTRTLHGPSLHREFVLMAEAGLSPMQILASATSNGARLMGRDDVGRVAEGLHADLLILNADPLADIRNTRRIHAVFRGGSLYEK